MIGTFRQFLRTFCTQGTILGLKYFYLYTDFFSRLFWATFIIFITQVACYVSFKLYTRYDEIPTLITIENQYEDVSEFPMPSITICSPNQITLSALKHLDATLVDGNKSIDLKTIIPQILSFYGIVELDVDNLEHLQKLFKRNRYDLTHVISILTQPCEEFLKLCFYRRSKVYGCRGIFHPILTSEGMCCNYNSQYRFGKKKNERLKDFKPDRVNRLALQDAFTVILDINPDNAVAGTLLHSGATKVMFNDWTEFPPDDETILVSPHTESFHAMQASYTYCSHTVTHLLPRSRDCFFEDESHLQYFGKYRNSDCDLLCSYRAVEERCHCLIPYLPNAPSTRICNLTSLPCLNEVKREMNELAAKQICECPRDCELRKYKVDTSIGNLNGVPYGILQSSLTSDIKINQSTSIMRFFFLTQTYVKKKQETIMSITMLVANLGGVFGFFLGYSVLTVFEIMFYLYNWIGNCTFGRIRRSKIRHENHYSFRL